jgi:DNA-cytosine methyltransferase
MKYISLFSGIGGFETAIHQFYKQASCVAYSEIDKDAIAEYSRHYPSHNNLGDITKIKKKDIETLGQIDLLVAGFPCNNLSSANTVSRNGLDGEKSGLFWTMIKIIKYILKNNSNLKIIIENNASMAHKWKDIITLELEKAFKKKVYCNYIDSSKFVLQRRRRYYWTLGSVPEYKGKQLQTMKDVLIPLKDAKKYIISDTTINFINNSPEYIKHSSNGFIIKHKNNGFSLLKVNYPTRWPLRSTKSYDDFIRCITICNNNCILLDYRGLQHGFVPRNFAKEELNKLFTFPDNYIETNFKTIYFKLYGMSVIPMVIRYILEYI